MKQRREEKEQLHSGEDFSEAHSSTDAEGQEVFGLGDLTLSVDETGWIESFGFFPKVRVHVNCVEQRHDLDILWQQEAIQFKVTATKQCNC